MSRLGSLEDYRTAIAPNGKMDYRMMGVHLGCSFHGSCGKGYQRHMTRLAKEDMQIFSQSPIELVESDESGKKDTGIRVLNEPAELAFSTSGELSQIKPSELTDRNIILTGLYFGNCHAKAFYDLLEFGASEIHIPQDCTNGFYYDDYPEEERNFPKLDVSVRVFDYYQHPFLDIRKNRFLNRYKPFTGSRGYQLFVPEQRGPYLEHLNGGTPTLVVFHRSWKEMTGFFWERR